jgi:hypothetical protein
MGNGIILWKSQKSSLASPPPRISPYDRSGDAKRKRRVKITLPKLKCLEEDTSPK